MSLNNRLSPEQIAHYRQAGYIASLPVFSSEEIKEICANFERLCGLLQPWETPYVMDGWEKYNRWLFELVTDSRLLDYVEGLLGPNFYQWGSNMMSKSPFEGLYVPWHQDAHDWPLSPLAFTTVWLALDDVNEQNGCLRVIPGSHRFGYAKHYTFRPPPKGENKSLLQFHVDPSVVDEILAILDNP